MVFNDTRYELAIGEGRERGDFLALFREFDIGSMLTPGVAASAYPSETAHFRPIVNGELRLRLLSNKSFIAQERWGASKQTYQFHFWWRAARALGSMTYLLHCAFTTSKSPIRTAGISIILTCLLRRSGNTIPIHSFQNTNRSLPNSTILLWTLGVRLRRGMSHL